MAGIGLACGVEGCLLPVWCKDLCSPHLHRLRRYGSPTGTPPPRPSIEERFWSKVQKADGDDCWIWGPAKSKAGYGVFHYPGGVLAHRFSWTVINGPIPPKLHVLHTCDNPPCVNPAHLFLGTQKDNVADMVSKGRGRGKHSDQPECKHGHPFTPENTQIYEHLNGVIERRCLTCRKRQNHEQAERRKAQRRLSKIGA